MQRKKESCCASPRDTITLQIKGMTDHSQAILCHRSHPLMLKETLCINCIHAIRHPLVKALLNNMKERVLSKLPETNLGALLDELLVQKGQS